MDQSLWLALGVFALVMTLAWLFVDTRRVTVTTGLAFGAWATMALTGGDVTRVLEDGTRLATDIPELQYISAALALLSALALILHVFGHYPPETAFNHD